MAYPNWTDLISYEELEAQIIAVRDVRAIEDDTEPTTSITWRSLEISRDLRPLKEIGDMIDIHYLVQ